MLKAFIFDCDGVIADTEPMHMACMQRLFGEEGIELTERDYFDHYLALDDRGCFIKAFSQRGIALNDEKLKDLIHRKSTYIEPVMRERLRLFPGVKDFIARASAKYPLAIASGALRNEIELVLSFGDISGFFRVIVSAEDVPRSKPYPDPFLRACALVSEAERQSIQPGNCLVFEDSIHGVRAARDAGMKCVAITNSYPREKLDSAEMVIDSFTDLRVDTLEDLFVDGR